MEKVVSHSDVNTMDAGKRRARRVAGVMINQQHKSNKSDCNIFDLFSPIIPYTLHVRHEKTATGSDFTL